MQTPESWPDETGTNNVLTDESSNAASQQSTKSGQTRPTVSGSDGSYLQYLQGMNPPVPSCYMPMGAVRSPCGHCGRHPLHHPPHCHMHYPPGTMPMIPMYYPHGPARYPSHMMIRHPYMGYIPLPQYPSCYPYQHSGASGPKSPHTPVPNMWQQYKCPVDMCNPPRYTPPTCSDGPAVYSPPNKRARAQIPETMAVNKNAQKVSVRERYGCKLESNVYISAESVDSGDDDYYFGGDTKESQRRSKYRTLLYELAVADDPPPAFDDSMKPQTLRQAICMYIDYLVTMNENRVKVDEFNTAPLMEPSFECEEYYHDALNQDIHFPSPKFKGWLTHYGVSIEITDDPEATDPGEKIVVITNLGNVPETSINDFQLNNDHAELQQFMQAQSQTSASNVTDIMEVDELQQIMEQNRTTGPTRGEIPALSAAPVPGLNTQIDTLPGTVESQATDTFLNTTNYMPNVGVDPDYINSSNNCNEFSTIAELGQVTLETLGQINTSDIVSEIEDPLKSNPVYTQCETSLESKVAKKAIPQKRIRSNYVIPNQAKYPENTYLPPRRSCLIKGGKKVSEYMNEVSQAEPVLVRSSSASTKRKRHPAVAFSTSYQHTPIHSYGIQNYQPLGYPECHHCPSQHKNTMVGQCIPSTVDHQQLCPPSDYQKCYAHVQQDTPSLPVLPGVPVVNSQSQFVDNFFENSNSSDMSQFCATTTNTTTLSTGREDSVANTISIINDVDSGVVAVEPGFVPCNADQPKELDTPIFDASNASSMEYILELHPEHSGHMKMNDPVLIEPVAKKAESTRESVGSSDESLTETLFDRMPALNPSASWKTYSEQLPVIDNDNSAIADRSQNSQNVNTYNNTENSNNGNMVQNSEIQPDIEFSLLTDSPYSTSSTVVDNLTKQVQAIMSSEDQTYGTNN